MRSEVLRKLPPSLVVSAGSGMLLALAFPRPDFFFLAWFALIPLFLVMDQRPFKSGFAAGIGFFAVVLYWLNIVMTTYGHLHPFFSVIAYLLLVLYLSLFWGAATWASWRLREKLGLSPMLTLPALWVALEYTRSFLLSGFPWATLGYSQGPYLPLIQSADLFGVYGISFLLILSNVTLACTWRAWRKGVRLPILALGVLLVLFSANLGYGLFRLGGDPGARPEKVKVGLIQGNIEQGIKWNPAYQEQTVERYRDLSLEASKGDLDLIVWPESATPFYFQEPNALSEIVREIPRQTGAYLLLGSPAYEMGNRRPLYLNSAFLLAPEGKILGRSDKVHLVPFGEYVPFGRFLPFVDKLVAGIGDFSPGVLKPLSFNGGKAGVLICFEGIFPGLAREYVRKGSDILVNITNDAWFGRSSAPWQHLGMTRFRAVENRIWVVRAANTGVTAFISPSGEITQETPLFDTAYLTGEVGMGARPTLYTRIGDLFPILFLALSAIGLLLSRRKPSIAPSERDS